MNRISTPIVILLTAAVACDTPQPQGAAPAATDQAAPRSRTNSEAAAPGTRAAAVNSEGELPMADIRIGGYLEVDDLDGTESGNRDANQCTQGSPTGTDDTCDLLRPAADNPNFPGPDPAYPNALGIDEADYTDWAHLDRSKAYFHYDLDVQDPALPDDILKQGSCVDTGPSPSKANIETIGVAGNDDYLYLMMERTKVQGQEEFHFFFTQGDAHMGPVENCRNPSWMWDLQDGDIQVTVRFQSTSGLPVGDVIVEVYNDPDNDPSNDVNQTAEQLIRSEKWGSFAGPIPAYAAFNVAPGRKALPDEDTERDLAANELTSGQLAEVAVDLEAVFGTGCGLSRVMTLITTASGSGGDTDDLKDFYAPVVVRTGSPQLTMDLSQECTESLGYQVGITGWGDESPMLGDPNLALDLSYECNGHSGTFNDDLGEGNIDLDIDHTVVCSVTAVLTGSGPYQNCTADITEQYTLYPDLGATGTLGQDECGSDWTWAGEGQGGQPPYSFDWDFSGVGFQIPADPNQPSGSGTLLAGTVPGLIHGNLTVTDARGCEATTYAETDAYHALTLAVTPTTAGDVCYDGDIAFDAKIAGGSGSYSLAWTEKGTADLGACAGTTSVNDPDANWLMGCDYDLGPGVCATGAVDLVVTDPICGTQGPLGVTASRTSSVSVGATP